MRRFLPDAKSAAAALLFLGLFPWTVDAFEPDESSRLIVRVYSENPKLVEYTRANQALVVPMSNNRSFYIYWVPPGAKPENTKILVPFHPADGGAYEEFRFWHPYAKSRRFALLVPQWRLLDGVGGPARLEPYEAYALLIQPLLGHQKYAPRSAVLYGRGEGASLAYGYAALEGRKGGDDFISGVLIDDGPADFLKPPVLAVTQGIMGLRVFDTIRWVLTCRDRCVEMQETAAWVLFHAGRVLTFPEKPEQAGAPALREDDTRLGNALTSLGL